VPHRHGPDPEETGARVQALLDELTSAGGPAVVERVEELVRALMDLYGAGLARVVELVAASGDAALRDALTADGLVGALLVLHDLHPRDVEDRVRGALDEVRPYLGSHAGGVELLGIDDDGVVHLRLEGTCDGCPSSAVTVKDAIERAIDDAAPEVTGVHVQGLAEPHRSDGQPHLVPVESLFPSAPPACPVPRPGAGVP
jgi:Fe-S cluster biogenesis protein NfuA